MKILLPLLVLLLVACGQSGDLYLPDEPETAATMPLPKDN